MTLRSGALPAGIKYLQEVTVGPSLGADSIRQGVRAAVIGMVAVMIFMLFYYHAAGINADLGLIPEPGHPAGLPGIQRGDTHVAGNCRSDPDRRYGRGFERSDLRAHSRRVATRQDAIVGGGSGVSLMPGQRSSILTSPRSCRPSSCSCSEPAGEGICRTLSFGLAANLFTAVFVSRVISKPFSTAISVAKR